MSNEIKIDAGCATITVSCVPGDKTPVPVVEGQSFRDVIEEAGENPDNYTVKCGGQTIEDLDSDVPANAKKVVLVQKEGIKGNA